MFAVSVIARITTLKPADIRFVLQTVASTDVDSVSEDNLLVILLYDVISQMGFEQRDVLALLKHYYAPLRERSNSYAHNLPTRLEVLVISDSRYASLSVVGFDSGVFDFKELEKQPQIAKPAWSLAFALPVLWQRALSALRALPDLRSSAVTPQ